MILGNIFYNPFVEFIIGVAFGVFASLFIIPMIGIWVFIGVSGVIILFAIEMN